jgi:RHS repeat-associated protein
MTSREWSWLNNPGAQAPIGMDLSLSYGATTATSENQIEAPDYAYDLNGNMTRLRDGDLATSASWTPHNEVASYSYGQPGDPKTVLVQFGQSVTYYLANAADPGIGWAWKELAFDVSSWPHGPFGVGFDTSSDDSAAALIHSPVPSDTVSIYTRTEFMLSDDHDDYLGLSDVYSLHLGADYDDGYVAWINGVEVYRSPEMPAHILWNSEPTAHESSNGWEPDYGQFHDISAVGIPALRNGLNILAIGVWRSPEDTTDLVTVPWLSANGVPLAGTLNNHRVAERYMYDASGYRLVRFPEAGDGRFVVSIRDAAGQPVSEFEMDPSWQGPRLTKDFIYGETGLLVERESVGYVTSVTGSNPLVVDGEYSFAVDDHSGASTYTVDIRTDSGYTNQLMGLDGSSGSIHVPESAFALDDTNYIRVRPEDVGPAVYSAPATLVIDSTVTSASTNQVRAISVSRSGTDIYVRFAQLESNGLSSDVHFRRGDTGQLNQMNREALPPGSTAHDIAEQSLAAPCGQMVVEQGGVNSAGVNLPTEIVDLDVGQPDCDQGDPPDPEILFVDSYHHRDHLGSLRVVTDAAGWRVSAHDYYPFGMEMFDPFDGPPGSSRMRFTGHERDEMTAADYMKARYKLASMVSFSRPDSAFDVSFRKPASWNKYTYVNNNPIRYTDPTGNFVLDIAFYFYDPYYGGYWYEYDDPFFISEHYSPYFAPYPSGSSHYRTAGGARGTSARSQPSPRDLTPPASDPAYETAYWNNLDQVSQGHSELVSIVGAPAGQSRSPFAASSAPLPPGCTAGPWRRCAKMLQVRREELWKLVHSYETVIPRLDIPLSCTCQYALAGVSLVGERFLEWRRVIRCTPGPTYEDTAFTFDREVFRRQQHFVYPPGQRPTKSVNLYGHFCSKCAPTLGAQ